MSTFEYRKFFIQHFPTLIIAICVVIVTIVIIKLTSVTVIYAPIFERLLTDYFNFSDRNIVLFC